MDENPGASLSAEVIDGTFDLAREGRVGPLGEMIDAGVPIDTRNARSDTLLIVSAYARQVEVVRELVKRGAALDIENTMGQTAVSCAVFRGDAEILRVLLDAGANPDVGFRTAAQIAEQFGQAEMSAILAEHAARS
jgi:uncharacterized protein